MAQAPAVPKSKRLIRRMASRILGLDPGYPGLTPSERAARHLAQARSGERWTAPDHVTFLIPMVGPGSVSDWRMVDGLLGKTLRYFCQQGDPRWRAIICCQVRPTLPEDSRIAYLPFSDPTPGNDKWRKLAALYAYLAQLGEAPGLAMTFDADDLAGPDLVARLLAHPGGTLVTEGVVYDAGHDRLALARPQHLLRPSGKAFWKLCGSCAAQPFDPAQASCEAQFDYLREMSQHEHRMIPYLAALAGHRLASLDGTHVLYLLNHGENFGARRGRVSFKTRFVERFTITDPALEDQLRQTYGLHGRTGEGLNHGPGLAN